MTNNRSIPFATFPSVGQDRVPRSWSPPSPRPTFEWSGRRAVTAERRVQAPPGARAQPGRGIGSVLRVVVAITVVAFGLLAMRATTADARSTTSSSTHVVVAGDSLWSIARAARPDERVGPVIAEIVRMNGLASAEAILLPGQSLVVPG